MLFAGDTALNKIIVYTPIYFKYHMLLVIKSAKEESGLCNEFHSLRNNKNIVFYKNK